MIYFGQDKMSEFYYGGTEIKEMYLGSTKVFQNKHPLFLTLETDGHGTLSADVLSGFEGDTVTLAPTYNTYYRFSGYDCTGGTITDNTFTFGNQNATVQAKFKVNAFTATGTWEKGTNVSTTSIVSVRKYAIHNAHTGDIPTTWYATSNRWNPSNASSYSVNLNARMTVGVNWDTNFAGAYINAKVCTIIGSNNTNIVQSNHAGAGKTPRLNYSKNITSTAQTTYSISGWSKGGITGAGARTGTAVYIATGTNGTWTATGIAP